MSTSESASESAAESTPLVESSSTERKPAKTKEVAAHDDRPDEAPTSEAARGPCPRWLDAELPLRPPKKTGADPSAGDEKEASAQRVKREQSVPKLVQNTR